MIRSTASIPSARTSSYSRSFSQTKNPSASRSARPRSTPRPAPLERTREGAFLARVAETGQLQVEPTRPEPLEVLPDRVRSTDRDDRDALGLEVSAASPRESLDRALVADPLDEDRRPHASISRNAGLKNP